MQSTSTRIDIDRSLLLVEDDSNFRHRLEVAMICRGYDVRSAGSVEQAIGEIEAKAPAYAVIDLRLEDGNGLDVVDALRAARPEAKPLILTGYGNIETAVAAVKVGAVDYLAKPTTADEIDAALKTPNGHRPPAPKNPPTPDAVKLKHIQDVFQHYDRNVSETARQLQMHRRTLQRILVRDRTP